MWHSIPAAAIAGMLTFLICLSPELDVRLFKSWAAPGSRALMLDQKGNIAEATTASVAIVKGTELIAPPVTDVLPSIAFEFSAQLEPSLGIKVVRQTISPSELAQADEVLWLSTPMCVLPVTEIDKTKIGTGKPGPVFSKLIAAWSDNVGLDIVKQANSA